MALIVKSSIDILPWTEMEKQKLIEEKKEFLGKKNDKKEDKKVEENKKELKNSEGNEKNKEKEAKTLKEDKKKEVKK